MDKNEIIETLLPLNSTENCLLSVFLYENKLVFGMPMVKTVHDPDKFFRIEIHDETIVGSFEQSIECFDGKLQFTNPSSFDFRTKKYNTGIRVDKTSFELITECRRDNDDYFILYGYDYINDVSYYETVDNFKRDEDKKIDFKNDTPEYKLIKELIELVRNGIENRNRR